MILTAESDSPYRITYVYMYPMCKTLLALSQSYCTTPNRSGRIDIVGNHIGYVCTMCIIIEK